MQKYWVVMGLLSWGLVIPLAGQEQTATSGNESQVSRGHFPIGHESGAPSEQVVDPVPAPTFPSTWEGRWQGTVRITMAGAEVQEIGMSLEIRPLPGTGAWTWRIGYEGQPARNYRLLPVDAAAHHWAVDEGDGVLLDCWLMDGALVGQFDVSSNRVTTRYAPLADGSLEVLMLLHRQRVEREIGGGLRTFPTFSHQRAILRRE